MISLEVGLHVYLAPNHLYSVLEWIFGHYWLGVRGYVWLCGFIGGRAYQFTGHKYAIWADIIE